MKYKLLFALFAVAVILSPKNGLAGNHQRDTWYIGFGIGGGYGKYEIYGKEITFDDWLEGLYKDPKVSLDFKVGTTLSPKTLLGFDITALGQTGSLLGVDAHIQINNYFLMLTHFPMEEGFFIRAGAGLSNIVYKIEGLGLSAEQIVNGYGILGGVGYALWLGESFNLTLNVDHSRQFYSGGSQDPDNSQFTIMYLGFDWY